MKNNSLPEYQEQLEILVQELGFDNETIPELFMLLTEEVGEFAKSARKTSGIITDKKSKEYKVEEEAADVLWLLLNICNKMGINLNEAFKEKVAKNIKRKWS